MIWIPRRQDQRLSGAPLCTYISDAAYIRVFRFPPYQMWFSLPSPLRRRSKHLCGLCRSARILSSLPPSQLTPASPSSGSSDQCVLSLQTGHRRQLPQAQSLASGRLHEGILLEIQSPPIATEALRNAFRHAQARQVEVEIRYDNEHFRLCVRDDGKALIRRRFRVRTVRDTTACPACGNAPN